MGKHVTFDYSLADKFIREDEVELMMASVHAARETLESKSGAGNDFLGWIDLPEDYDKAEFERIQAAAKKIQSDSDVLVVIGIGGSYLGARAAIEFLRHCFYNSVDKSVRKTPEIYYAGNNISGTYLAQLIETIGDRDFSVNVISKSGTTTEPDGVITTKHRRQSFIRVRMVFLLKSRILRLAVCLMIHKAIYGLVQ